MPLIHQGSVYLFGAAGDLHALDLKSGDVRWSRGVVKERLLGGDEFAVALVVAIAAPALQR